MAQRAPAPGQEAFWEHHGLQCELLHAGHDHGRRRPARQGIRPSEEEVREALAGNLCRCTGYHNIVKAVMARPRRRCAHDRDRQPLSLVGRPGAQRKEDPRMITGRGRYVDDLVVPGMLKMAVVVTEAHARSPRSTPRRRRRCRASTASSPARTSTSAAAADGVGPAGRRDQDPWRTGRWPRTGSITSARASPSWSATTSTRWSTPRSGAVEYDPLPVVVDPRRRRGRRALVHPSLGTNQGHEWSIGGGDMDGGGPGRGRRGGRAADRQPPHRRHADQPRVPSRTTAAASSPCTYEPEPT